MEAEGHEVGWEHMSKFELKIHCFSVTDLIIARHRHGFTARFLGWPFEILGWHVYRGTHFPDIHIVQWFLNCGPNFSEGLNIPFTGVAYQISTCQIFTLLFITVAKLQLWSSNENNFMVGGGHHNMRNCIKTSQYTTWRITWKGCSTREIGNRWSSLYSRWAWILFDYRFPLP